MVMKTIDDVPLNTWWKRKSNGKTYFLKEKGFGKVALVELYQSEVRLIAVEEFILHANNGNFIKFNTDGTLQI
jgi:hypothetical protein